MWYDRMFRNQYFPERLKKLYISMKHTNGLPLTSEDIQEREDLQRYRNTLLLRSQYASQYGLLGVPSVSYNDNSTKAYLTINQVTLLVDGDLAYVKDSSSRYAMKLSIIKSRWSSSTVEIGILGWYEPVSGSSSITEYGGIHNDTLTNDLVDPRIGIQVSSRYEFKWVAAVRDPSNTNRIYPVKSISIQNNKVTSTNTDTIPTTYMTLSTTAGSGTFNWSDLNYTFDENIGYFIKLGTLNTSDSSYTLEKSLKSVGGGTSWVSSSTEPLGAEEGLLWYNPTTGKVKIGNGVDFVSTAVDYAFTQYSYRVVVASASSYVQVTVGSDTQSNSLLVYYNGLLLSTNDYSLQFTTSSNVTTLKFTVSGFTLAVGDEVIIIEHKLINAESTSTLSNEFATHKSQRGSGTLSSHVYLSDSLSSSLGIGSGYAATPKLVYDATTLTDTATGKKYRLTITNGTLGVTQIS